MTRVHPRTLERVIAFEPFAQIDKISIDCAKFNIYRSAYLTFIQKEANSSDTAVNSFDVSILLANKNRTELSTRFFPFSLWKI